MDRRHSIAKMDEVKELSLWIVSRGLNATAIAQDYKDVIKRVTAYGDRRAREAAEHAAQIAESMCGQRSDGCGCTNQCCIARNILTPLPAPGEERKEG